MCIILFFSYKECGHECQHLRPCQEDGSLCYHTLSIPVRETCNDFCRDCFMLPDPRVAQSLEHRSKESIIEWLIERYQNWNVEAETQDLQIRVQNLPPMPGHQYNPDYPLSNRIPVDLLPTESIYLLTMIVYQRLIPDFWIRVIRGENPSRASRESILCLRQILMVDSALTLLRSRLPRDQWQRYMGYQPPESNTAGIFDPVALPLFDNEECGICRVPLKDIEAQGVPVKTHCNHVFHQRCLEEWLELSPNGDCPACRAVLQGANPAPQKPDQISEWLTSLGPRPQAFPTHQPITDQYIQQLNANVDEALVRAIQTDRDLTAIETEIIDTLGENSHLMEQAFQQFRDTRAISIRIPRELSEVAYARHEIHVRHHQWMFAQELIASRRLERRRDDLELLCDRARADYHAALTELDRATTERARREFFRENPIADY
ncbi:hypothetical protein OCU04_002171 [Sclerotinia nivalis]|uniref:RING-type domain-containing protein n=1 Tax=Sclerotinia nivalis TaxID=352851 RepID=A0A9X0AZL6_9HELO|nr:hypothetical protein OCU04_002171 [Sclerotinia nivalis]